MAATAEAALLAVAWTSTLLWTPRTVTGTLHVRTTGVVGATAPTGAVAGVEGAVADGECGVVTGGVIGAEEVAVWTATGAGVLVGATWIPTWARTRATT